MIIRSRFHRRFSLFQAKGASISLINRLKTKSRMSIFSLIFYLSLLSADIMALSRGFSMPRCTRHVIAKSFYMSSRQYAVPDQTLSPEHQNSQNKKAQSTLRDRLRRLTGFSLTASRATLRAATGVSLTAIYASTLAATGLWIRKVMHVILSLFPAWVSWLLQPRQNCLVSCLQSS